MSCYRVLQKPDLTPACPSWLTIITSNNRWYCMRICLQCTEMTCFCTLSLFTPCLIEPDEVSLELMDPWFYGNCCLECEKRDTGCFCSEIWCTILLHDEPHQISLRSSHLKHWSQSRRNCSIRCVFDRIKRTSIGSCHGARPYYTERWLTRPGLEPSLAPHTPVDQ